MKIRAEVEIAAPLDTVWAALQQIDRHVEWMADAEEIRFRTDRRQGIGTEFTCLTRIGPFRTVDVMTVTEWEPRQSIGVRHRGVVQGVGRFVLRPVDHGATHFTWAETLRFPARAGGPVGGLVGRPVLTWVWRRNLARFKALVEAGEAA